MRFKFIFPLFIFWLTGSIPAWSQIGANRFLDGTSERACIVWNLEPGQEINKRQTERLYLEAYKWVGEHVYQRKAADRPCITVDVGRSCPDLKINGPCANPVTGEIFVPRWESASPGTVAQGVISTMLLHLLDAKEITTAAQTLLLEDSNTYFDFVPASRKK